MRKNTVFCETCLFFSLEDSFQGVISKIVRSIAFIKDEEIFKIIDLTKDYCDGYTTGPLYFKNPSTILRKYIEENYLWPSLEYVSIDWMNDSSYWQCIRANAKKETLRNYLRLISDKPLFETNIEAVYS